MARRARVAIRISLKSPNSMRLSFMNSSSKIAISILSLAALALVSGCSSKTEEVKSTTAYVPLPSQETVVVQPAPVVAPAPSTVNTTEEKSSSDSSSNSSDMGNNATRESSSAYHRESSTVTPMAAPPQQETTTTYQKKTYQESNYQAE